jgi:hypothetical protein
VAASADGHVHDRPRASQVLHDLRRHDRFVPPLF